MSSVLERLAVELYGKDAGLRAALDGAVRDSERAASSVEARWEKVGERLTNVGSALSVGITAPITAIAVAGIRGAASLEQMEVAFGTLAGSAERGRQVLDDVRQFAAETPFQFPELAASTRQLLAFGVAAEDSVATLRMIGDVAAGVGAPISDIAYLYGTARVQGRLFAQDINQLTNRGIPIIGQLAKQFGVAESEVRGLVEAGAVGFPELERAFAAMTSEGGQFFSMMGAQSQTAAGKFSTLKDNAGALANSFGEVLLPTANAVVDGLLSVTGALNELPTPAKNATVAAGLLAAGVGPLLVGLGQIVTVAPKVAAGFALMRTAALPFLGPAGILLLIASGATALGIALAGAADKSDPLKQRQEELATAVDTAKAAIGTAGTKEGLVAALEDLGHALGVEGSEKLTAFAERARAAGDDLETLRGKAFETAKELRLAQLEADRLALVSSMPSAQRTGTDNARLIAEAEDRLTRQAGFEVKIKLEQDPETKRLQAKLANDGITIPADQVDLTLAIARELQNITANLNDTEARARLDDLDRQIAEVRATEAAPSPERASTPTPTPTGGGTSKPERTARDVFVDLERAGIVAERQAAAFGNTLEARLESLQTRSRLVQGAITELIGTFDFDPAAGEVQYLVGRLEALNRELEALGARNIIPDVTAGTGRTVPLAIPKVRAAVDAAVDITVPKVGVKVGQPVRILGMEFDPETGRMVNAGPGVRAEVAAAVNIAVTPKVTVAEARPIIGSGFDESGMPVRYGPQPYAQVAPAVPLMGSPGYSGPVPRLSEESLTAILDARALEEVNKQFLNDLEGIMANAAAQLGEAIATGDFSSLDAGGLVGSVVGLGATYGLNLLLPGLGQIAGPFLGSLFGGLVSGLTGESDKDPRSEAAKDLERRGGAAQVNITFYASQTNHFSGALDQQANRAELDRQNRKLMAAALEQADFSRVKRKAGT